MAMSDCEKCWDTPCTCGWDYRFYTKLARLRLASVILGVSCEELERRITHIVPEKHPQMKTK